MTSALHPVPDHEETEEFTAIPPKEKSGGTVSTKTMALGSLAVLALGVFGAVGLFKLKAAPDRAKPETPVVLVETAPLVQRTVNTTVEGFGTVIADRMVELRPQVQGHITSVHPQLQEGGRIPAGETIVQIDPRDYEIALANQKAALTQAQFELTIEQGNQVVAEREWKLLGKSVPTNDAQRRLALREPHLEARQASLNAAKSMVEKAELDLTRTTMVAPFDAIVLTETAEQGQFASNQMMLGTVAATDKFLVKAKIKSKDLKWLREIAAGSPVTVKTNDGSEVTREGQFVRLIGDVDSMGRQPEVLISIKDPLATSKDKSPLLLGSYVRVSLAGTSLSDVYAIPRRGIRENNEVWLKTPEGTLTRRPAEVVYTDDEAVYVRNGFPKDSTVIVGPVSVGLEGMAVATEEELEQRKAAKEASDAE